MPEQPLPSDDSGQTAPSDLAKRIEAVAAVERFLGLDQTLGSETPRPASPIQPTPTEGMGTRAVPPDHAASAPPGYKILAELGRGGMGVVYKARHLRLGRVVALKMILAGGHAGLSERLRFLAEAEVVAAVQHPNIVALLEYGEHEGLPFFTLEFVPGGSLAHSLNGAPQPARDAARLIEQMARGIHYAHTRGIVHRDLKPANVLLAEDGTPKITDFGLARRGQPGSGLTATGEVLGTPSYMAPEQAGGETKHAGPAADIYALGAILYECLTGRPPFRAASTVETVLQVVSKEPVPVRQLQPHTPVDLATICHKCLQKEPHKRYASAQELAEDCAAFLEGKPIRARAIGTVERGWRWCRRNPALAGALCLGIASLLVGSVLSLAFAFRAEASRQSEELRAESEARAKRDADQARRDAQRQLVDLCVASGTTAARDGDHALALLWFARAVQLAKDDSPQEELNRIRIANWLRTVSLPEGTFAITGFRQNQDRFRQFQFSPDGNYLVVVATTGDCLVWDRQQQQLLPLPKSLAKGTAAAWQPRSNVLAIAVPGGPIRLVAAPDFRPVSEIAARGEIGVLAFSRDGKRLAWGGSVGARVWDREKKEYITPLLLHGGRVTAVSLNSAGDLLATACSDKKARVFRVFTGDAGPLFPPVAHVGDDGEYSHTGPDVYCPRFAAGDRVFLTVDYEGNGGPKVRWRSSTTGRVLASNTDTGIFAVDDLGEHVAALGEVKGHLLDGATAKVLAPIPASPPGMWNEHATFSLDDKLLVACGHDTRVRFWSVEDRSADTLIEACPAVYHPMLAVRVGLSANGRHLAVGLWDGSVYLWRMPSGPPVAYRAHAGGTTAPALSPDKRFVMPRGVTYREGNQLATRVYDADTGKPAGPTLDPGGILLDATFSPDGTQVVTASSTGRTPGERNSRLFAPGGKGGNVQIWDWKSGKRRVGPIPMPSEPRGLAFRPDGSMLAVVCADYYVVLVDPKTGTISRRLDPGLRTHPNNANQWQSNGEARFSPDGRFLVTWEMTPHVHVWDPDSGKLLHTLPHTERVGRVAFTPMAPELLATAGWGSNTRVWDMAAGKLVVPLKHPQWIAHLDFAPQGKELLTSAADGSLRVWDWRADRLRDGWPFHARGFDFRFTADRRWLVTVDEQHLQVIDWATKTPVSPRWKTQLFSTVALEVPGGDRRAIIGGFGSVLVGYALDRMRTRAPESVENLVALSELAAGRRILSQGNIVPLGSGEWQKRWEKLRQAGMERLQRPADADHQEGQAWLNLAATLHDRQDLGAAVDAYTKGLALEGNDSGVWQKLGLALHATQDWTGAVTAFKKALAIDRKNATAWFNLGNALRQQKDEAAAVAAYRETLALAPQFAEAHCNLGLTLQGQGDFVSALAALKEGHALGSRRVGWRYLSGAWVQRCEQLLALEKRIPGALQGEAAAPADYLAMADLCQRYQKRYGDAARLYGKALTPAGKLPARALPATRYDAACAAALAAGGQGVGAASLSDRETLDLRRQALDWLGADLAARRKLLTDDALAAAVLQPPLEHWLADSDLAGVRDADGLASLPPDDREAWRKLWTDVGSLIESIRKSHTTTERHGALTAARREQSYPLVMSAGKSYVIDMASTRLDAYLRLEDEHGKVLAENDDIGPDTLNARIVFRPTHDATYRIVATSFQRRGTGDYGLTIRAFAGPTK